MAWVKLDDNISDHPKILAAGPLPAWLFVCGLTYCARYMTDGFIPTDRVRRLADVKQADKLAERLVQVKLWTRTDGGFLVHDYLEYQPSARKAREQLAAANERMGRVRANSVRTNGEFHKTFARNSPSPSHPVPSHPGKDDPGPSPARARAGEINPAQLCAACQTPLPRHQPSHGLCSDCHGRALLSAKRANVDVMHISLVELVGLATQPDANPPNGDDTSHTAKSNPTAVHSRGTHGSGDAPAT